jgi:hypothetical protein
MFFLCLGVLGDGLFCSVIFHGSSSFFTSLPEFALGGVGYANNTRDPKQAVEHLLLPERASEYQQQALGVSESGGLLRGSNGRLLACWVLLGKEAEEPLQEKG